MERADYQTIRDYVASQIRRRIISGEYPAGARLVERDLADQLGVSRNPVREALRVLDVEGFVDTRPRHGTVVSGFGERDIVKIFEVRETLEPFAARLAVQRATQEQLDELSALMDRATAAQSKGDRTTLSQLHLEFHELVLQMTDNRYLYDAFAPLRNRTQRIVVTNAEHSEPDLWSEHIGLAQAIVDRDPDAAAKYADHHLQSAKETIVRALRMSRQFRFIGG